MVRPLTRIRKRGALELRELISPPTDKKLEKPMDPKIARWLRSYLYREEFIAKVDEPTAAGLHDWHEDDQFFEEAASALVEEATPELVELINR